ncbi:MAG: type IX secretion system membrane protein PorP/SprF [Bacteroidales bacterium]
MFLACFLILSEKNSHCQTTTDGSKKIGLAYPVYSQYLHNGLLINPAYAGSREVMSLFTAVRKQWVGIEGAPSFATVSLHTLLKNQKVGLGFTAQFLKYGLTQGQSIFATYAYQLHIGSGHLALGLRAGFDRTNTDYSKFSSDESLSNDPAFTTSIDPVLLPNVGAGAYFYNNSFFAGVSVPSILGYSMGGDGKPVMDSFTDFDIDIYSGALLSFSEGFKFKPSVLVEYPLDKTRKMRLDINGNFIVKDILWIGGSWRTTEKSVVGIIQVQATQQFMFGYSYDYPLGTLGTYSDGSHELVLRFEFGYRVSASNPRYF